MIYLELILLAVVVVFIVDISGIADTFKDVLGKMLNITIRRLRPFDCSLCMVWWSLLVYALCIGELNIYTLAYIALLSALAMRIADLMRVIDSIITKATSRWL